MDWKPRSNEKFDGNFLEYMARVRKIKDLDSYLDPPSSSLLSPTLLKNLKEAVKGVNEAINNKERITVVADVDPDGVISTYMAVDYLRKLDADIGYVHAQRSDGHGVETVMDKIPSKTDLLLILDSSSNSVEECEMLSESMDIIIIDHHIITKDNPHVLLVNPQQQSNYPKSVCAAYLVFKFIELMDYEHKKVNTDTYMGLTGLALLADNMAMTEDYPENRYLLNQCLSEVKNVGLLALIKAKKLNQNKLKTMDLSFQVVPLINSATRMDKIELAFDLLFETDFKKAKKIAGQFLDINKERKAILEELSVHAREVAIHEKVIIVVSDKTTKNFNGLVAMQLTSEFGKPAIVLQNESHSGSYRSPEHIDMMKILNKCPYAEYAAGHKCAGGTQILPENLDNFIQWINEYFKDEDFEPTITYDVEIDDDEFDLDLVKEIMKFDRIHGNGVSPVIARVNNIVIEERQLFPKTQEHLKIIADDDFEMLKFGDPEYKPDVDTLSIIDVLGKVGINDFKGVSKQIIIDDLFENN
ncbi:DHH family phosphoesterase [Halobacillus litoralis]|uniref:DHH family phosphoesterase n=1 Tax=Halobacillus litoralis TaxID=45668 RepID=UPI001CD576A3|nr:DHH family phosphoesterase [Halobacillus litoralis]MCA1021489.1 DHH family phosphoesterase [Halobacillus litoralis]